MRSELWWWNGTTLMWTSFACTAVVAKRAQILCLACQMQTEKASSAFNKNHVGISASPRYFYNAAAAETVARGPGPVSFSFCFIVLFLHNTLSTNNNVTRSSLWGKLMLHPSCVFLCVHILSSSQVRSPRLWAHSVHSCHIALRSAARWMPCALTFSRAVTEPCVVNVVKTSLLFRPARSDAEESHLFPLVSWEFWFYYR